MTFANTDCVGKDWYWGWRKVAGEIPSECPSE